MPPRQSAPTTAQAKTRALAALAETGIVLTACESARVARRTFYDWLHDDPEFAARVDDAREAAADLLEREAIRRARDGVEEPVFQGGVEVGRIRKYSDTLLIFTLKGLKPERYRERFDVRQTVVTIDAIDAEIARLTAELGRADRESSGAAQPAS